MTARTAARPAADAPAIPTPLMVPTQTASERIKALQAQAKALAMDEVADFEHTLALTQKRAAEIAAMGDAVPAGIRERARNISNQLEADVCNIASLRSKGL